MSYTEIYKFNKKGDVEPLGDVRNAFRGAMAVWRILEKKYLPSLPKPIWEMSSSEENKYYSRCFTSVFGKEVDPMKEIWDLFKDDNIPRYNKIVLGSTFDNVVVKRENITDLIKCFKTFEYSLKPISKGGDASLVLAASKFETSMFEQATLIEAELEKDSDFIAIAWNQTSVCSSPWVSDREYTNEYKEEEYHPYNLFKDKKHWFLFDNLSKKQS